MTEIVQGEQKKEESQTPKPEEVKVETKVESQETSYTDDEQRAMDQGWDPEYDGPNKRTAKEFLDRGELLTKIKETTKELRKVQEIVGALTQHNKQVYEAGYRKAIGELMQVKAKAIEERNGQAVAQIDEAIDNHKEALRQVQNAPVIKPNQVTPAFQEFLDSNSWYTQGDKATKAWAFGKAEDYAESHPNASEEAVYEFVTKEFKKKFGDSTHRGPPSPNSEGRTVSKSSPKSGDDAFSKLLAGMPEDQARAAKEMVKRGILTKEKYVEDYNRIGS